MGFLVSGGFFPRCCWDFRKRGEKVPFTKKTFHKRGFETPVNENPYHKRGFKTPANEKSSP